MNNFVYKEIRVNMLKLFRNHKPLLALTLFLSVVTSVLTVAAAFLLEAILNSVIGGNWELFRLLIWVVVGFVGVTGASVICGSLAEKKLIVSVVRDLRASVQKGIMGRDSEHYRGTNTADYLSALTNDVKIIEENLIGPFLNSIQYALVFAMAAVALFIYSPYIGAIMLGSLLLMYILPSSLGKPIGIRQEAYSKNLSLFTLRLKDQFMGYDVIRSFRLRDQVNNTFSEDNTNLAKSKFAVDRLVSASEGIAMIISAGTQLGVMMFTGYLVLNGQMAAGALLAILQLSGIFVQPVAIIMQNIPVIKGAGPVFARLNELSKRTASAFQGTEKPVFAKGIHFDEVNFGYTGERLVLDGLDLHFEKGKKYVIAGASGCGKSTIIRLLCAEYSGYTGAVRMDGKELHDLDIDQLLTHVSIIHQGVYMFDETIKDNIDLHRTYSAEEWERALYLSGVDKFLPQMEQGLDTPVGEDGANLSGGQRQRIAVARALIEGKPLLILDEGTSAVDPQTAYDIESALVDLDDLTMITITHNLRPEMLRRYDKVFYMENGRIAEAGDFDTLIELDGAFASFRRIDN